MKRRQKQSQWHSKRHRLADSGVGWFCAYCTRPLDCPTCHPDTTTPATIDHIVQRRDGGTHGIDNLALSCQACQDVKDNPKERVCA